MAIYAVQSPTTYLAGSGVIIGATSITVTSFVDIYGNTLTLADFGTKGQGTLEPDTTNEEACSFAGITVNSNGTFTLTGVKTALAKPPFTETNGLVRQHAGGTKFVVSDTAGFWNTFTNKNNNETIVGKYTLPGDNTNRPTLASDVDTTTVTDVVTYGQLARQAVAGAPNASTTVKGIVQVATQAQRDAKTATGSTGALLVLTPDTQRSTLLSDYVADTGAANAYVITPSPAITAYTTGQIFSFKATNANTTTSTLNINGLGVKTIKKLGGTTDLASGDIAAGQIVLVEYDGTSGFMQLMTPSAKALNSNGDGSQLTGLTSSHAPNSVSSTAGTVSTQNVDTVYTTTFLPKTIVVNYYVRGTTGAGTASGMNGTAIWDGTTIQSNFFGTGNGGSVPISVSNIAPVSGDGGTNDQTAISIINVTSTGYTVRIAFIKGSTWNGLCLGSFTCFAIK